MDNNYTNTELLIKYLDKELSPEETSQLEQEMKQNINLQQELENLSMAKNAVRLYGLKQRVGSLHAEMMQEINTAPTSSRPGLVRLMVRRSMQVAAGLLLVLLGFGTYQYLTISTDKLFIENYHPYELSVSRGISNSDTLEKAYLEKNFLAVIKDFEALATGNQKQNFLGGQAYLETNTYLKAIACFNKVLSQNKAGNTNILQDDAQYYLALSYLKNKQVGQAYPYFQLIHHNPNHLYNDKVTGGFMRKLKMLEWKN